VVAAHTTTKDEENPRRCTPATRGSKRRRLEVEDDGGAPDVDSVPCTKRWSWNKIGLE
jgi:hypothetical protein